MNEWMKFNEWMNEWNSMNEWMNEWMNEISTEEKAECPLSRIGLGFEVWIKE